jgi:hypothetical protein
MQNKQAILQQIHTQHHLRRLRTAAIHLVAAGENITAANVRLASPDLDAAQQKTQQALAHLTRLTATLQETLNETHTQTLITE